tara:strand:+ start:1428 stop:1964 length:537 start_codon:yes stop_codon:yes gene_type:complete
MPERVTKEERKISLAIEKARDAKEELLLSLENNRNPIRDESEHFKLKRPKAEKDTTKFESNDGPATNHAYAGEMAKFSKIKKMLEDIIKSNPVWEKDAKEGIDNVYEKVNNAHAQLSKIMEDVKAGKTDMHDQMGAINSILTMLNELRMLSGGNIREGPEDPHTEMPRTADDPTLDKD